MSSITDESLVLYLLYFRYIVNYYFPFLNFCHSFPSLSYFFIQFLRIRQSTKAAWPGRQSKNSMKVWVDPHDKTMWSVIINHLKTFFYSITCAILQKKNILQQTIVILVLSFFRFWAKAIQLHLRMFNAIHPPLILSSIHPPNHSFSYSVTGHLLFSQLFPCSLLSLTLPLSSVLHFPPLSLLLAFSLF